MIDAEALKNPVTAQIPRYVSEDESDGRGLRAGWFTVGKRGGLGGGPFANLQDCEQQIACAAGGPLRASPGHHVRKGQFDARSSWHPKQVEILPAVRLTWAGPFWITE